MKSVATSKKISNHVNRRIPNNSHEVAVYNLYPSEIENGRAHLAESLLRQSVDCDHLYYNTSQRVFYNAWALENNHLLDAISSFNRHLKHVNQRTKRILCLSCHGREGKIIWNNNVSFSVLEILSAVSSLQGHVFDVVCFMSCFSLKTVNLPPCRYSVLGFVTSTFVDQCPYFLSRFINEYCRSKDVKEAISSAIKFSDINKKQIKYRI